MLLDTLLASRPRTADVALGDRLKQIVESLYAKGIYGIVVVGRSDNHLCVNLHLIEDVERDTIRELHVEEYDVGAVRVLLEPLDGRTYGGECRNNLAIVATLLYEFFEVYLCGDFILYN